MIKIEDKQICIEGDNDFDILMEFAHLVVALKNGMEIDYDILRKIVDLAEKNEKGEE